MRDHGGDLDAARALYGPGDWLDLSTGINPAPYPLPPMPPRAFTALPSAKDIAALEAAAQAAYATEAPLVALAGAQAAIQLIPRLAAPGLARVLGPTYNEHAAALAAAGWRVETVFSAQALAGADLAVVVNPNNPDARRLEPQRLFELAARTGLLCVDESFADAEPELSLLPQLEAGNDNIVALRSFGKFYGHAGLRLGFAAAGREIALRLRALAGPWPVSGPAIFIGRAALADSGWRAATLARIKAEAARLDALAQGSGWRRVGSVALFSTYDAGDAGAARDRLARAHIWPRVFPWSSSWIRLGLPGTEDGWRRLEAALEGGG